MVCVYIPYTETCCKGGIGRSVERSLESPGCVADLLPKETTGEHGAVWGAKSIYSKRGFNPRHPNTHLLRRYPIGSMGLVYLPTFG